MLSPHGHVEHALYLVDDGEATWVHVEPGTAEAWSASSTRCGSGRRSRCRGPQPVVRRRLRARRCADARPSGVCTAPMPRRRRRLRAARRPRARTSTPVAARPGCGRYEALRIAAGRPRLGFETDHRTIPHEVGWLGPPSTSTRAATAARRRSRGCTTSAGRRAGWCCCTSTAATRSCPRRRPGDARRAGGRVVHVGRPPLRARPDRAGARQALDRRSDVAAARRRGRPRAQEVVVLTTDDHGLPYTGPAITERLGRVTRRGSG